MAPASEQRLRAVEVVGDPPEQVGHAARQGRIHGAPAGVEQRHRRLDGAGVTGCVGGLEAAAAQRQREPLDCGADGSALRAREREGQHLRAAVEGAAEGELIRNDVLRRPGGVGLQGAADADPGLVGRLGLGLGLGPRGSRRGRRAGRGHRAQAAAPPPL